MYDQSIFRQQSVHLGLSNATIENTNEQMPGGSLANETTPIIENTQSTNLSMTINPTSVLKYENALSKLAASSVQSNGSIDDVALSLQNGKNNEALNTISALNVVSPFSVNQSDAHRHKRSVSSISPSPIISSMPMTTVNATQIAPTYTKSQSNRSDIANSKSIGLQKVLTIENANRTNKSPKIGDKNRNDALIGRINVLIHNISVISNADKDYFDNLETEWTNSAKR